MESVLKVWGDEGRRRPPTYFKRGTASSHFFVDKWLFVWERPPTSFGASPTCFVGVIKVKKVK